MSDVHDQITERLSEYLDGELTATDRASVEAHLASGAACRAVAADLRMIVAAAAHLPGALPERELWGGVEERIAAPKVLSFRAKAGRRFAFTLPQLAAAGIALMLTSGGMVYLLRPEPAPLTATAPATELTGIAAVTPVALVDPQYDGAIADLERTLAEGRGRLDPETVRVLEQNLSAIDQAIAQCRRALEADPANTFLNSHLVSARQRKLALLRRATALTTGS